MSKKKDAEQEPQEVDQAEKPRKTLWKKILGSWYYLVLVLMVAVVFLMSNAKEGGKARTYAGFGAFIVLSGSMETEIPRDSIVIVKSVEPEILKIGDDITYLANETTVVTHRIIEIHQNYNGTGKPAFRTQGIMNNLPDAELVIPENLIGQVIWHNYWLGRVVIFISAQWPVIIFLAAVIIALSIVLKKILGAPEQSEAQEKEQQSGEPFGVEPEPEPLLSGGPCGAGEESLLTESGPEHSFSEAEELFPEWEEFLNSAGEISNESEMLLKKEEVECDSVPSLQESAKPLSILLPQASGSGQPLSISLPQASGSGQPLSISLPQASGSGQPLSISLPQASGPGQPLSISLPQASGPGQPLSISLPQASGPGQPLSISLPQASGQAQPISISLQPALASAQPMTISVQVIPDAEPGGTSKEGEPLSIQITLAGQDAPAEQAPADGQDGQGASENIGSREDGQIQETPPISSGQEDRPDIQGSREPTVRKNEQSSAAERRSVTERSRMPSSAARTTADRAAAVTRSRRSIQEADGKSSKRTGSKAGSDRVNNVLRLRKKRRGINI